MFPTDLPECEWKQFAAAGYSKPVSGVIFRTDKPPCCGVPLGGLSTGCLDIETSGVLGFASLFSRFPVTPQLLRPFLGLATGGKTYVLATRKFLNGGRFLSCTAPGADPTFWRVELPKIEGVEAVREIHYWGHYPIADLEYETDAPVSVGLRAWSPFVPGDTPASSTPALIFEIHLRNTANLRQTGTVAFSFPGPDPIEAHSYQFARRPIDEQDLRGVEVTSSANEVGYVAAVIGGQKARTGSRLDADGSAWAKMATELPQPAPFRGRSGTFTDASCSLAVDFELEPMQVKIVRLLLAWYAPRWKGEGACPIRPTPAVPASAIAPAGEATYQQMYARHYRNALEVASRMVKDHDSLLQRVLAWQEAIYADKRLPVWLRDALVNNLALIAEDSFWAMPTGPLADWCGPEGLFGLNESVRSCPQVECIPCSWYGNLPIVYFFPELALSTLRGYKHYMREDGAVSFIFGPGAHMNGKASTYDWQQTLNGFCFVDLVDRVWQQCGDDRVLREFYPSAKRTTTYTMNLRRGPGGVISMPEGNKGMEWFEWGEWAGMCAHLGGLRLAQLRMIERMARHMGDRDYVKQCQAWLADGTRAMEEEMWTGSYYLNFYEKETGKKSDDVMAYQLDGQWAALFHGLPAVFMADRVKTALETIKRCNIALTPEVGAANFCRPDGSPLSKNSPIAYYGLYSMFTAELVVLAMTYIYAGQTEFGLELARRHWETLVRRQRIPWDLPNSVMGEKGERRGGSEYYQAMMLWAMPAALERKDISGVCAPGGLVARVQEAGRKR